MAPVRSSVNLQAARECASASPRQREGLQVGIGVHRLHNTLLGAVARLFDAAEWRHLGAITRHFPDVDGADLEFLDKMCRVIETVGTDPGRQAKGSAVRSFDEVVDAAAANDRDYWTEGFLEDQFGPWMDMINHYRREQRTFATWIVQYLGALSCRV